MLKIKKSLVAASAVLFASLSGSAVSYGCDCASWARAEQIRFCSSVGGGSACATSPGLYQHLYNQCKEQNICSR
ncbi:hypothetical protein ACSLBF_12375 [Pseudoalteromonas sp. T1lg65]|uniref:hypothetical protein n=1 Tax=Pseudoalteromonas sp. T1lg65 TaxID=2077101 RepID=UPI003F79FCFE